MNLGFFFLYCVSGLIGLIIGLKLRKKWLIAVSASVILLFGFLVLMTILLVSGISLGQRQPQLESNGGSAVSNETVDYNSTATKPSDPTKTGYTFSGWYSGTNAYDFSTPITGNTTLSAQWTIEVSNTPVTVNGNQTNLNITAGTVNTAGNNPVSIDVPPGVTNTTLNVAGLLQSASSGVVTTTAMPALNIIAAVDLTSGSTPVNVQVQIPQGTTVSAPAGWNSTINVPTVQATSSVNVKYVY